VTALADLDVGAIPREELPSVLGRLVELEARVRLRLSELPGSPTLESADRLLDVEETARRLGVSTKFIYRTARRWPCARHVGRRLLFSEQGLARQMSERGRRG
jgi:hypothetical protein